MSLGLWIGLGVLVWIVLALVVVLLVGRVVRARDRQVPHDAPGAPVTASPEPASPSGRAAPRQDGPPDVPA